MRQTSAEAEALVCAATGLSRIELLTRLSDPLPPAAGNRLAEAVLARESGVPLAYIVGEAPFFGRVFRVGPGCLVPRPETEILVERAIGWLRAHPKSRRVFDLGCGSGNIAVTLALECPDAMVEAVDISEQALEIARTNAERLGAKLRFCHADGLAILSQMARQPVDTSGRVNLLVSNPPYIPTSEVQLLDSDVRDHEPHIALAGGADGLDYYRALITIGAGVFEPDRPAAFLWEVGTGQADAVIAALDAAKDRWSGFSFCAIPDLRGVPRIVFGARD